MHRCKRGETSYEALDWTNRLCNVDKRMSISCGEYMKDRLGEFGDEVVQYKSRRQNELLACDRNDERGVGIVSRFDMVDMQWLGNRIRIWVSVRQHAVL